MPKMVNAGPGADDASSIVPTIKRMDGEYVRIPRFFTGVRQDHRGDHPRDQFLKHTEGQVYISLMDSGFYAVPKGGSWEVPPGVTVDDVKAIAPHMITEEEYLAMTAKDRPAPAKPSSKEK